MTKLEILNDEKVLKSVKERLVKYQIKTEGCWEWNGHTNDSGYPALSIGGRGGTCERVSRIMLYLKEGYSSNKPYALHKCDNPECTNPDHLYWGTPKQNMEDAIKRGSKRNPPVFTRENHPMAKWTVQELSEIQKIAPTLTYKELAAKLQITYDAAVAMGARHGFRCKSLRGQGVPPKKLSFYEKDGALRSKLIQLALERKSSRFIAKELGVSSSACAVALKRLREEQVLPRLH